jgi:uroporphyrin-III C-methyltransferase
VSSGAAGKVYLVGAGPGDPELLTLKALHVLREADVVLHDDLISEQIIALIPRTALIVSVGKRCGNARVTQDEINALIVAYARSVRTVVRLKSGDPLLFGRAGEELEALRAAGLEAEIVPGISVAFAAAAALETSLTDRRTAARVVFSTGHRASGSVEEGTTHVVYMPSPDYVAVSKRLLREGFTPETPCALVSAVSLENQIVLRSTLGNLPGLGPVAAPSILLVGEVLRHDTVQPNYQTWADWPSAFSHQYRE